MKDLLCAILDGSFDAGLLLQGDHGQEVIHANSVAQGLFGLVSEQEQQNKQEQQQEEQQEEQIATPRPLTMDQLVKVWKHSLECNNNDDDDYNNNNKNKKKHKKKQTRIKQDEDEDEDVLPWSKVMAYVTNNHTVDRVQEWTITGTKQQSSLHDNHDNIISLQRETFPGVLKLTRLVDTTTSQQQQQQQQQDDNVYWLVHVRHADAHQIVTTRNNAGTGGGGGGGSSKGGGANSSAGPVRRNSSTSWKQQQPCLTLDENGMIVDINDYALDVKHRNDGNTWSRWVHADLIGQHISQATAAVATATTEEEEQKNKDDDDKSQTKNKKKKNTLQIIIESKFSPGHSSCPGSGYLLNPQNYDNTAMTTGNAVREENITEAAFEAALDPIFQINEHGTIQMVNSAATAVFGWRRHEEADGVNLNWDLTSA